MKTAPQNDFKENVTDFPIWAGRTCKAEALPGNLIEVRIGTQKFALEQMTALHLASQITEAVSTIPVAVEVVKPVTLPIGFSAG